VSRNRRESTLGQLVTERPARAHLFERLGLDYCCGGRKRLADAARSAGLDVNVVLRELDAWDASSDQEEVNWSKRSMTELVDHIVASHHTYLRQRLPTVALMLEKVVRAHGKSHPELLELRRHFASLWGELECHMLKEEKVLFPICRAMEHGDAVTRAGVSFAPDSVQIATQAMIQEHEDAGDTLATMRALTHGYTPPEDACATYRSLLAALAELESDMHQHVHKENNLLFPRAIAAVEAAGLAEVA